MFKETYNVIGVMSGTSLDGIDLAHIHFSIVDDKWRFKILEAETVSYNKDWLEKLKIAVDFSESELQQLNEDYTVLLANIIKTFIEKNNLKKLDAVCSHGHTILHQPQNGITLQIGNLPKIAKGIGQTVVCDFRVQDVLLGGQGAPLVPIGDQILFSEYDYCLNLGGFSNVSFEQNGNRIAFDISPVNTVLNFYANQLGLDYYKKSFPKSLGFEFVKTTVLPLIERYTMSIEDKMHTFTEHIAIQTAVALDCFETRNEKRKLLATGGGTYNDFLMERMQYHLPQLEIIIPDKKIIEFKEALIFALLGVLKLRNEINVLSSVTGAKYDHAAGFILSGL